jgi:glycosyltransferase involved in cell wall biosynthesis
MIVTDVGGLKETIGDRGTGIVVQENTPEAIRTGIIRYFDTPEIRQNCIANIQAEKERLSWSTFAQKLEEFIKNL